MAWYDNLGGPDLFAEIDRRAGLPPGSIANLRRVAMSRMVAHLSGEHEFGDAKEILRKWPFRDEVARAADAAKAVNK